MIVVGADHGGVALKRVVVEELAARGEETADLGTGDDTCVDYPDYARAVAERVARGDAARGVLVCTSGIGMAITANKFPGVRAALVHDVSGARSAREHNDANVLVLGGGVIGPVLAREVLRVFLDTPFAGGRHQRRVDRITAIEHELGLRRPAGALR
jgi:ribose 5-phosphate isomerase B